MFIFIFSSFHDLAFYVENSINFSTPHAFFQYSDIWIFIVVVVFDDFFLDASYDFKDSEIYDYQEGHNDDNITSIRCYELDCCDENDYVLVNT